MDDAVVVLAGRRATRRRWLVQCSVLAAALGARRASSAPRQGTRPHRTVLVVGDSLSAEYGLARGSGWVALLARRLAELKIDAGVVNASISGDTTSGGRSRLPALLREHRPTHVIFELGANDALRGLPLELTRANLGEMTRAAKAAGAKVVVVGMQLPPNYGRQYGEAFSALFGTVAKTEGVAWVPFLLHGVADVPEADTLFQTDRIHPKEAAHPAMLENVWRVLGPMLTQSS